jgi:5-methyltetrahydrofolate--homocysteine methyltransferase
MLNITQQLLNGRCLVCDGAWGTELFKLGLKPGECPELWNIEFPKRILSIASSYVKAGADIIETNSFGASPLKLASFGLGNRSREINRLAASISREAAGPDIHVAGSIGPTGKMLIMGDITEQELYESLALQATALEEGGADIALIETMIDSIESSIAVRAVKENSRLDIIATATYNKTQSGFKTMMGASIEEISGGAIREGASIIGTNCGYGTPMMINIVDEIHRLYPEIPIMVQPNAGIPVIMDNGEIEYPETPEYMASHVNQLIAAGANNIGGCCGTTPEHIQAIAKVIKG